MATTTPLGFQIPDGTDLANTGDDVIAANGALNETLHANARARLAQVEAAAGFPGTGLDLTDDAVHPLLDTATTTRDKLDARYANDAELTAAVAGKVSKGELAVNARDYGVTGNGTTPDGPALLTAANAAVALGYPLIIPAGFVCAVNATVVFPAGLRLETNGAQFKMLTQTGRISVVQLGGNTTVTGGITTRTLGGVNGSGVQIQGATNVSIDFIDVESSVAGQGIGNIRDNGLNINNSSFISIGRVRVRNFDYAIFAETVPNLTIGWIDIDTYVKGLSVRDTSHLRVGGGRVRGTSPNSAYTPGHNGVLVEANSSAEDIRIDNVAVHDAGEHGFRVSGPAQIKNVWITNCSAINCTGTGFKVLGAILDANGQGIFNENFNFINCLAEDCGLVNQNTNGFLLQQCKYVKIVSPIIRNRNKTSAGYAGIRLGGVSHVQVTDADIKNSNQFAIYIDSEMGNVSQVKITANIEAATGWGAYLANGHGAGGPIDKVAAAQWFDNIEINLTVSITAAGGAAFYAAKGTYATEGTWTGFNKVTVRCHDNMATPIGTSTVAALPSFHADITGKKNGTMVFRNGSRWLDTTTGNTLLAKGGAWVTL